MEAVDLVNDLVNDHGNESAAHRTVSTRYLTTSQSRAARSPCHLPAAACADAARRDTGLSMPLTRRCTPLCMQEHAKTSAASRQPHVASALHCSSHPPQVPTADPSHTDSTPLAALACHAHACTSLQLALLLQAILQRPQHKLNVLWLRIVAKDADAPDLHSTQSS